MISAAEWTTVEREAKQAGVDKFLSKPLFPSMIMDIINECLGAGKKDEAEVQPDYTGLFAGHHILLAEDVEINREIVLALLEETALEIDCAVNGVEAVSMFSETPEKYDAIFMDIQMPEMDGYEATRRIRALGFPYAETIPIIAMTANVFKEDVEKSMEAGMTSHIGKPLDFDMVLEKLRFYLLEK
jgi:CheY-like chemotaxis protein